MELDGSFIPALLEAIAKSVASGYHYMDIQLVFNNLNEVLRVETKGDTPKIIATIPY